MMNTMKITKMIKMMKIMKMIIDGDEYQVIKELRRR